MKALQFEGKKVTHLMLEGEIIWQDKVEPENPETYYVEYSVNTNSGGSVGKVSGGFRSYLPRIINADGSYTPGGYEKIEIILNDGTITDDPNTIIADVERIRVYYPIDAQRVYFNADGKCIKELFYIKSNNFTDMSDMFRSCGYLESINASCFNTKNVKSMHHAFANCYRLTSLDLSNWNTKKVTDMSYMFSGCTELTSIDLSNFNTKQVTKSNHMFYDVSPDIEWNYDETNYLNWTLTESETNYSGEFPWDGNDSLYYVEYTVHPNNPEDTLLTVDPYDPDNVSMYSYCYLPRIHIDSQLISFSEFTFTITLKDGTTTTKLDTLVENIEKIKIEYGRRANQIVFGSILSTNYEEKFIKELLYIRTDNFTSMAKMFAGCSYLEYVNTDNWNTRKCTSMAQMFDGCTSLNSIELNHFDTSNLTNTASMFKDCTSLIRLKLYKWDTRKLITFSNMFEGCTSLRILELDKWIIGTNVQFYHAFKDMPSSAVLYLHKYYFKPTEIQVKDVSDTGGHFAGTIKYMETTYSNYYAEYNLDLRSTAHTIHNCLPYVTFNGIDYKVDYGLVEVVRTDGIVEIIDPQNTRYSYSDISRIRMYFKKDVVGMSFAKRDSDNKSCYVNRVFYINTSNFTTMENMFYDCVKLSYQNQYKFDTSKVTNMSKMFAGATYITQWHGPLDWDTSKVTDMSYMFAGAFYYDGNPYVNLERFDTRNVTNAEGMFNYATHDINFDYDPNDPSSYANWTLTEEQCSFHNGIFPWNPNPYYVEYRIDVKYEKLNKQFKTDTGEIYYRSLPLYAAQAGTDPEAFSWFNDYTKVEIFLRNGDMYQVIGDLSDIDTDDIDRIRVYYPKYTRGLKFQHSVNVKEILYMYSDKPFVTCESMFHGCTELTEINFSNFNIDTSSIASTSHMFYECESLTSLDLTNLNTSSVTDMSYMFYGISLHPYPNNTISQLDLSPLITDNVTDMSYMFSYCTYLKSIILESFNTSNVTNMSRMFYKCQRLTSLDLRHFNVDNVTDMNRMFYNCHRLTSLDLSTWNMGNTDIEYMFAICDALDYLNLSGWDTSNLINVGNIFDTESTSKPIYIEDWGYNEDDPNSYINWNLTELDVNYSHVFPWNKYYVEYTVDAMHYNERMDTLDNSNYFKYIPYVIDENGKYKIDYLFLDIKLKDGTSTNRIDAYVRDIESIKYYYAKNTKRIRFYTVDESPITNVYYLGANNFNSLNAIFANCTNLESVNMSNTNVNNVTDMSYMFYKCNSLKSLNLSRWDTNSVTTMRSMFYNCNNLTSLNLSGWNTNNVTDMNHMFYDCESLTTLDLSSFITNNVTDMSSMFYDCESLTSLDLSSFITNNVTDMNRMFRNCESLTSIDLSSFITNNVTDMSSMFYGCYKLSTLDLSSFNTINVTDMSNMFHNCDSLTSIDLSSFDTSNVTNMNGMFYHCESLASVDLSSFNTSNVTNMKEMFWNCVSLEEIDLSNFNLNSVTTLVNLLSACNSLKKINLSNWDTRNFGEDVSVSGIFTYLPFDGIDWCYDGNNYQNFTLTEDDTDYIGIFPWSQTSRKFILFKFNSIDLPDNAAIYDMCPKFYKDGYTLYYDELNFKVKPFSFYPDISLSSNIKHNYACKVYFDDSVEGLTFDSTKYRSNIKEIIYLDTSTFTTLSSAFYGCNNLNYINCKDWDLSNMENLNWTFAECRSLKELDMTNWSTPKLNNMQNTFRMCTSMETIDLTSWDTSGVASLWNAFYGCSSLKTVKLENMSTTNATVMDGMFYGCSSLTSLDLSHFKTDIVINMNNIFNNCSSLTSLDLSAWNVDNVLYMNYMFNNCSSLESLNLSTWNTSNVQECTHMFRGVPEIQDWYFDGFNYNEWTLTEEQCSYKYVFPWVVAPYYVEYTIEPKDESHKLTHSYAVNNAIFYPYLPEVMRTGKSYAIDFDEDDITIKLKDGTYTHDLNTLVKDIDIIKVQYDKYNTKGIRFYGSSPSAYNHCLKEILYIRTDEFITMSYMFNHCAKMIDAKTNKFDTRKVTSMANMFTGCKSLVSLDLTSWDVSGVTNMSYMFSDCSALHTLNLSGWNTEKVTTMRNMFQKCSELISLNVSNWNTEAVDYMQNMFYECSKLETVDLSTWNTRNVTNMSGMFMDCHNLTNPIIGNFNTEMVDTMTSMFKNCTSLTSLTLPWNTSRVKDTRELFYNCNLMSSLDLSTWDTINVELMLNMFALIPASCGIKISNELWNPNMTESKTGFTGESFIRV